VSTDFFFLIVQGAVCFSLFSASFSLLKQLMLFNLLLVLPGNGVSRLTGVFKGEIFLNIVGPFFKEECYGS